MSRLSSYARPEALQLPPANLEAEQAVLGALLRNNKVADRIAFLEAHHFADSIHGLIYAAMRRRIDAGRLADAVTMRQEFANSLALAEVGGDAYLAQLLGSMVSMVSAGEYAAVIRDCWLRRQVIDSCMQAIERARGVEGGELAGGEILGSLDADLAGLSRDGNAGQELRSSSTVAAEVMAGFVAAAERAGGLAGITTGYAGLDRMLGGFMPGQLILLAGRPGMGKTAASLGITARSSAEGHRWLYASAEMNAAQVQARAVAAVSGEPLTAVLRGGCVDPESGAWRSYSPGGPEAHRIAAAVRRVGQLPIEWDDTPMQTVASIRAKARAMKRAGGLAGVMVDYLGRIRPSERAMQFKNRVQEVSEMARAFKELARELEVPVVLLSQLSREVEKRPDKRPILADLRDSGEIEQEADTVLFLYREHYYLLNAEPQRDGKQSAEQHAEKLGEWTQRLQQAEGRAEIIIAKQRQGPIGPVRLRFDGPSTWFRNDTADGEPAVPGLPE